MKRLFSIILPLFLLALPMKGLAHGGDIAGKDFWVFLTRYNETTDSISLYVVGDTACTGYVENEFLNFHLDFTVLPNSVTIVKIPKNICDILPFAYDNLAIHNKGVFVHTSCSVFLYLQVNSNLRTNSSNLSPQHCDYLYSPLTVGTHYPWKIPIWPISYNEIEHYSLYDNSFLYPGWDAEFVPFAPNFNITAMEDSVMIFAYRVYDPSWGTSQYDTILLSRKGESVWLKMNWCKQLRFHTNCKKVISYFSIGSTQWSFLYMGNFLGSPGPITIPLSLTRQYYCGQDYLCKKLHSDRFDKGIYFKQEYNDHIQNGQEVTAYNYNEYFNNYLALGDLSDQGIYGLNTGNHRMFWGDTTVFVDVPYTFLRSQTIRRYNAIDGPNFFICKNSAHGYPHFGYMADPYGCASPAWQSMVSLQPTERMVKEWVYPTTRDNLKRTLVTTAGDTVFAPCDSLYVDVQIYTHEDGIGSTYFNGQLVPPTAFDTFPMTNGEYWVAQLYYYNDDIPELIRIENERGFSAYVDEFGYNVGPAPAGHHEIDDITYLYYYHSGASGCYSTEAYQDSYSNLSPHNNDTVYRCVNDTLHLRVEHNPDSVPIEWIYNGDSYPFPELSFPLTQADTLTVQLVYHYDGCPDTSTTFVVVVPRPVFTYCHDDTLCHGAQLSVEQPNVLSYLWSDGSSGPAITLDSAGTYSVTVTNLGCRAESDLFTIDLYPQSSVEFGNDSILCELATLLLDATQPHPAGYVWQDQSTNTTYTVYEDGQYWVVITDNCLGASDTIAIGYLTDFAVDLGPDTTLCEGRTLTLSAGVPFCDYEWQDGSTQPTYIVRHPGIYSVSASNKCFEHGDDIVVEYEPCEQELWMPNSFTPDGDGLNDLFLPVFSYPDEVESFEMTIYDRWGMVMFSTKSKDQGWDAAGVPIGTYVVFIRYKSRGHETRDVTGSVAVIR